MKPIATIAPAADYTPANAWPQEEAGMFDVINKSFSDNSLLCGASSLLGASEWKPCQRRVKADASLSQDHSGRLRKGSFLSAPCTDPTFMRPVAPELDDVESESLDFFGWESTRSGITPNISAAVWL